MKPFLYIPSLAVVLLCLISFSGWAETLEDTKAKAEQGFAIAQVFLGSMYRIGEGVDQDYDEALKWYTKASEQGVASAQYSLGWMYYFGYGVLQDYAKAHMWFNLAAADGDENASKNRDAIAKAMTSEQIAEAQKMAREWMEEHGED